MDVVSCFQEVERGTVHPAYILYGEEKLLQERLVASLGAVWLGEEWREAWGLVRLDGAEQGWQVLEQELEGGILGAPRRLVVVENPPGLGGGKQSGDEDRQRWKELVNRLPPDVCLVLRVFGTVDRRREPVRTISRVGRVWELPKLKQEQLSRWIVGEARRQGLTFAREALDLLTREWAGDLAGLRQEIAKLAAYMGFSGEVGEKQVQELVDGGVGETVFQLLDAVTRSDTEEALLLLGKMQRRGEAPLLLLHLLAQKVRLLEAVRSLRGQGYREQQVAQELGQHPYPVKKTWAAAARVSGETTRQAMEACLVADRSIKKGRLAPELALELLVTELCSLLQPASPSR